MEGLECEVRYLGELTGRDRGRQQVVVTVTSGGERSGQKVRNHLLTNRLVLNVETSSDGERAFLRVTSVRRY